MDLFCEIQTTVYISSCQCSTIIYTCWVSPETFLVSCFVISFILIFVISFIVSIIDLIIILTYLRLVVHTQIIRLHLITQFWYYQWSLLLSARLCATLQLSAAHLWSVSCGYKVPPLVVVYPQSLENELLKLITRSCFLLRRTETRFCTFNPDLETHYAVEQDCVILIY